MEPLIITRAPDGRELVEPGPDETWDELADHAVTHDQLPSAGCPEARRAFPRLHAREQARVARPGAADLAWARALLASHASRPAAMPTGCGG
jgi:hypothetical protein